MAGSATPVLEQSLLTSASAPLYTFEPLGSRSLRVTRDDEDAGKPILTVRRTPWGMTALIVTGEVMGTGVLALPHAFAQLGWVLGLSCAVFFGLTATYSGVLLTRVKNIQYPEIAACREASGVRVAAEATSFADVALTLFGPRFAQFTRGCILSTWALLLPYYLITAVESLQLAFPHASLCFWQWSLLVCAGLLPFLQLRSLHLISLLSAASTAAMVAVTGFLLATLAYDAAHGRDGATDAPSAQRSIGIPPGETFLTVYSSMGSFIFAYQGQSMFLEIMREMQEPRSFPRALYVANGLMGLVYTASVAVGYGVCGSSVARFLPDSLPAGPAKTALSALLTFHVGVAYLITGQPLHRNYHRSLFPATADESGPLAATHWLLLTLGQLAFGFFVANAIPFFADFQNLLGTLTGAPIVFGWPALFYLRGHQLLDDPKERESLSCTDGILCALFLLVFLPLFTVLGTLNACRDIMHDWNELGRPFACHRGDLMAQNSSTAYSCAVHGL